MEQQQSIEQSQLVKINQSISCLQSIPLSSTLLLINLSHNSLTSQSLSLLTLPNLQTLLLDHNLITSLATLPPLQHLQTLSLNHNHITYIDTNTFINNVTHKYPRLKCLNLINNPINPLHNYDYSHPDYLYFQQLFKSVIKASLILDGIMIKPSKQSKQSNQQLPTPISKTQVQFNSNYKQKHDKINILSEGNRFLKNQEL